jgi:hypothetical protein
MAAIMILEASHHESLAIRGASMHDKAQSPHAPQILIEKIAHRPVWTMRNAASWHQRQTT